MGVAIAATVRLVFGDGRGCEHHSQWHMGDDGASATYERLCVVRRSGHQDEPRPGVRRIERTDNCLLASRLAVRTIGVVSADWAVGCSRVDITSSDYGGNVSAHRTVCPSYHQKQQGSADGRRGV